MRKNTYCNNKQTLDKFATSAFCEVRAVPKYTLDGSSLEASPLDDRRMLNIDFWEVHMGGFQRGGSSKLLQNICLNIYIFVA